MPFAPDQDVRYVAVDVSEKMLARAERFWAPAERHPVVWYAGTSVPSHARPNVFCMSRTRDKALDPNAPWSEMAMLSATSRIAVLSQEEAFRSGADARLAVMVSGPEVLLMQARSFAEDFSKIKHESLLGVTDGKAVGTYIETAFKLRLLEDGVIQEDEGNAAKGIDLPSLNTDIKVTSIRQPQSSSPFASFRQKIEGLGYDLILFVYDKLDEAGECSVEFRAVRRIPARLTGDFTTTQGLRRLILDEHGNADDVFAFLAEKNIPADESSLYEYGQWLLENPPEQGHLTISNALQWRLQYGRVVAGAVVGIDEII